MGRLIGTDNGPVGIAATISDDMGKVEDTADIDDPKDEVVDEPLATPNK